jgi:rhodanese-related sulfurtransferase
MMKKLRDFLQECLTHVQEIFPWDLLKRLEANPDLILLDVREPHEFEAMHIAGSLHVPRGVLETACDWDYEETVPELAAGRDREIVIICRSGNRSVLAADTMQAMGFKNVVSLRTGIRGWNDFEQPLVNKAGNAVTIDDADEYLAPRVSASQRGPALR